MRLCVFGDSFVNGTGDPDRLGWLGRAAGGAREITLYDLGVRGDSSADIRKRWRAEAEARLAGRDDGRLVFAFGVNDCCPDDTGARRVAPDAALDNATAILRESSARWPTLMIGPPPIADETVSARVAELDPALAAAAARLDVPYCSVFAALRDNDTWMRDVAAWDGAHPGEAGYAALARLIMAWPAWRGWFGAL
jgi:lysophospholipase L1-like esterase